MSSASVRNGEGHLAAGHVEQTRIARVHAATTETRESQEMRIPILLRGALVALIALFGVGLQNANADNGGITLTIYKGGWIIGGSAGGGTLTFRGRSYRLGVGGIDYGLLFGGSKTVLRGRVRNIQRGVGRCRRLRRGRRGAYGERRPERASDHDEIVGRGLRLRAESSPVIVSFSRWHQVPLTNVR